jgi:hypothetical protein
VCSIQSVHFVISTTMTVVKGCAYKCKHPVW